MNGERSSCVCKNGACPRAFYIHNVDDVFDELRRYLGLHTCG